VVRESGLVVRADEFVVRAEEFVVREGGFVLREGGFVLREGCQRGFSGAEQTLRVKTTRESRKVDEV
jgi:hypothetical protein